MAKIFLLWHVHCLSDDKQDEKLIGVYETEDNSNAAISRLKDKPGFSEQPTGLRSQDMNLTRITGPKVTWKKVDGRVVNPKRSGEVETVHSNHHFRRARFGRLRQ